MERKKKHGRSSVHTQLTSAIRSQSHILKNGLKLRRIESRQKFHYRGKGQQHKGDSTDAGGIEISGRNKNRNLQPEEDENRFDLTTVTDRRKESKTIEIPERAG